jgi:4'-phosphopantetheinyl transferase
VDVWLTPVPDAPDPSVVDAVRDGLDAWEAERLTRFRRPEDQVRYAAAHALVRVALSAASPAHGVGPRSWRLVTAPDGKPHVDAPAAGMETHFSLSHTPGLVGCAVASGMSVGFDVEVVDRPLRLEGLVRRTLASTELQSRPADAGDSAAVSSRWFLRYWTLKEALLKARGTGLRISPTGIELAPGGPGPAEILALPPDFGDPAAWRAHALESLETHVAAVAVRCGAGADAEVRRRIVALNEVLETFAG